MTVFITLRQALNKYGQTVDILESDYVRYFSRMGVRLIMLPNDLEQARMIFENIEGDGLILSGGNDIDIQERNPEGYSSFSADRDNVENYLLEKAVKANLPVLGICRGMQKINEFFGGLVCDDIQSHGLQGHPPGIEHRIELTATVESWLGENIGQVNSYHNHGVLVDQLAGGVEAFALAEQTGIVEGLFVKDSPIAGIQWHPERRKESNKLDTNLIQAFINRGHFWEIDKK